MGVLGLVCRLYNEREETKENREREDEKKEEKEKEGEKKSDKRESEPVCRYIKIEMEEDNESDESPVHESNEEEFLTEDENEYYWD